MADVRAAPAFQFYADDFIAGTVDMTAEERGVYITLLCIQWSKGFVDPARVSRYCAADTAAVDEVIRLKFQAGDDGMLRNARLERIRQTQQSRAVAGSKGGSKTAANSAANSAAKWPANGAAKQHPPTPTPTPSPTPSSSPTTTPERVGGLVVEKVDLGEVRSQAVRLKKAAPFLGRERCWQVAWVAVAIQPGMISGLIDSLRDGEIKRPAAYVDGAIKRACEAEGYVWSELKQMVPALSPAQKVTPPEVVKAAAGIQRP